MPPQPSDYMEDLNTVKVLAFMEVAPLTDRFQQIALTSQQAREMRDALVCIISPKSDPKAETVDFQVVTNDAVEITLPDVRDAYDQAFIKAKSEKQV